MGQLESFNPATGELVGTVTTITPEQVQGGRRRRRRGAALLGAALARRSRPLHARAADVLVERHGGGRRPAHPRAGQADHRELRDGADPDDRRAALVRERGAEDPRRREDPLPAGVPEDQAELLLLRAARRRRRDRAVELPVVDPVRRGRAGADRGQRGGAQAGEPDAAARRANPAGLRRRRLSGGPGAHRARRRRDRPGAVRGVDREDLLHRLGRGRAQGRRDLRRSG